MNRPKKEDYSHNVTFVGNRAFFTDRQYSKALEKYCDWLESFIGPDLIADKLAQRVKENLERDQWNVKK